MQERRRNIMEVSKKGFKQLKEVIDSYEDIRYEISDIIEAAGYDEEEDGDSIIITKDGNEFAVIDLAQLTINITRDCDSPKDTDELTFLLELSEQLENLESLLDEDVESETYETVECELVSEKALHNIAKLEKGRPMGIREFMDTISEGLTTDEQVGVLATFDVLDNVYPVDILMRHNADIIVAPEEKDIPYFVFNPMLGVWVEDDDDMADILKTEYKKACGMPFTISIDDDEIFCPYISDDHSEDIVLDLFRFKEE